MIARQKFTEAVAQMRETGDWTEIVLEGPDGLFDRAWYDADSHA